MMSCSDCQDDAGRKRVEGLPAVGIAAARRAALPRQYRLACRDAEPTPPLHFSPKTKR